MHLSLTIPSPAPSLRRAFLIAILLAAPAGMVRYGLDWWRNVPESDEFVTVLHFLSKYTRAESTARFAGELFTQSNEHRTLTSRLVFLGYYRLFGSVNFASLAVIGCGYLAAAIAIATIGVRERKTRWLLAILLSLSVFNLQHYENLFCSCASADHLLIVLLSTASLALLARRHAGATFGALVCAALAVYTLTHGLAVLGAGAILLAAQRRWRELAAWGVATLALGAVYFSGFNPGADPLAGHGFWARNVTRLAFWLTLVGGYPALGHEMLAAGLGLLALIWIGWLSWRGAWQQEPFLMALAWCAGLSIAVIAAGRAGSDTPVLSSRYLVQSAVGWSALAVVTVRRLAGERSFGVAAIGIGGLFAVISAVSNFRFHHESEHYHSRRIVAARQYDLTGSMHRLKYPIFPYADQAEAYLREAEQTGVFILQPRRSRSAGLVPHRIEQNFSFKADNLMVGQAFVHLRGWLLPPLGAPTGGHMVLILRNAEAEYTFRAFPENRPDVAATFMRPDRTDCGFYFVIPRAELGRLPLQVLLGYESSAGASLTVIDQNFDPLEDGTHRLAAPKLRQSVRFQPSKVRRIQSMPYSIDQTTFEDGALHIRGWLIPPDKRGLTVRPVLFFRNDETEYAYRGVRQNRPDVAATFNRPELAECGFAFVVPRSELGQRALQVLLGFQDREGGMFTVINTHFDPDDNSLTRSLTLEPEASAALSAIPDRSEQTLQYFVDELGFGRGRLQMRGWLIPPVGYSRTARPVLLLRNGKSEHAFLGIRQSRPDVAASIHRQDDTECGFLFIVPRAEIEPIRWQVSLGFTDERTLIFTHTDHLVDPSKPDLDSP